MIDDLEPGPAPLEPRNPKSKQPDAPLRVPQVLRSYAEDAVFSIRQPTEVAALAVKAQITAAVYWLNRWETDPSTGKGYDLRVRPYLTEHYEIGGHEYDAKNLFEVGVELATDHFRKGDTEYYVLDGHYIEAENLVQAVIAKATDHYWKVNFWVHPPLKRGMRQMPKEQADAARRKSAEKRGIENFKGSSSSGGRHAKPKPGRRVQKRADE